jgi:hypothetical protein
MRFTEYSFGSVRVDRVTYHHDLIIDRGQIRKRKKAASDWAGFLEPARPSALIPARLGLTEGWSPPGMSPRPARP